MGIRRAACKGAKGGEADVKNHKDHDAAVRGTRPADRTLDRAAAMRIGRRLDWRSLLVSLVATLALTAAPGLPGLARDAKEGGRTVAIGGARTTSVTVLIDKSEDVHTDQPFVD